MEAEGGAAPARLRARIQHYYGGDCRILAVRRAWREGAFLFVIDAMQRGHLVRMLGTIGRGGGSVMEQSAMDLARPERLVFSYERAMLVSLALVAAPRKALLLGLGGGAMCPPSCRPSAGPRRHDRRARPGGDRLRARAISGSSAR